MISEYGSPEKTGLDEESRNFDVLEEGGQTEPPAETPLSDREIQLRKQKAAMGLSPDDNRPIVKQLFEKNERELREQLGAGENEPVFKAWVRKTFGKK